MRHGSFPGPWWHLLPVNPLLRENIMGPTSPTMPRRRRSVTAKSNTVGSATNPPLAVGLRETAIADQQRARLRDDLIASHMAMAARLARMFAGRGVEVDDLTQVACARTDQGRVPVRPGPPAHVRSLRLAVHHGRPEETLSRHRLEVARQRPQARAISADQQRHVRASPASWAHAHDRRTCRTSAPVGKRHQ